MTNTPFTISVTYDVVTPESAKHGDFSESGCLLEPTAIDTEALDAYLEDGIDGLMRWVLPYECNHQGNRAQGNEPTFSDVDPVRDDAFFRYGEEKRYTVHLNGEWPSDLYDRAVDWLTGK